jgi:hypothetical protein
MGIDVYAKWDGQTEDEKKAQITGFSIVAGEVGYLREAYHGGPYATKVLFPECFTDGVEGVREDLSDEDIRRFEEWAGFPVSAGRVEGVLKKMHEWFGTRVEYDGERDEFTHDTGAIPIPAATLRERLPAAQEATRERYEGDPYQEQAVDSVTAFVELYERLEAEGKNPRVYVSY